MRLVWAADNTGILVLRDGGEALHPGMFLVGRGSISKGQAHRSLPCISPQGTCVARGVPEGERVGCICEE